jgi:hypothetical protein
MWPILLVTLATCQAGRGPLQGLPAEIQRRIGKTEKITPCSVSSLPGPVRRALGLAGPGQEPAMADPGQDWNSSDMGQRGLPRAQLVRAVHSDGIWVVDFWKGGFAVTYRVVVIALVDDNAEVVWQGRCHGGATGGKGKLRCAELKRAR